LSLADPRAERVFYVGATAAMGALVFAGFARSFYLHSLFGVSAPAPFFVFHGVLMVVVGCLSTLKAAAREVHAHSPMLASQFDVLALELTQMALFGGLVGAAVVWRRRPDWHKRLMLLATLCLLPNPIVRLSLLSSVEFLSRNIVLLSLWALVVAVVGGVDTYRRGGVHPAYGVVGIGAVVCLYGAYFVGRTEGWVRVAEGWVG